MTVERPTDRPIPSRPQGLLVKVAKLLVDALTIRHFSGLEHIPATGGVLVVCNHISNFDPLVIGRFVLQAGRWPRFVAKSELWEVPLLGALLRAWRMIPVRRSSGNPAATVERISTALRDGDVVVIYPEGTITSDPDGWPMVVHSGMARLALATGVPVVPVGQMGADAILGGRKVSWRSLFSRRRRPVHVAAGAAVGLGGFSVDASAAAPNTAPDRELVAEVSAAVMDAVTGLVVGLRGQEAPAGRWDPVRGARVSAGGDVLG